MSGADTHHSTLQADESARRLAKLCFDAPVWIEAGAGTGKTALLVARLCVWCLGIGWERAVDNAVANAAASGTAYAGADSIPKTVLRGLLALTFTEKAAAEMQTRLCDALAGIAQGTLPRGLDEADLPDTDGRRAQRAQALLAALTEPVGMTLHSFAQRLVRLDPEAAGFPFGYRIDGEGHGLRECIRRVVDAEFRRAFDGAVDALWLEYLRADGSPQRLVDCLEILVQQSVPTEELAEPRFTPATLRAYLRNLLPCLEEATQALTPFANARGASTTQVPVTLRSATDALSRLLDSPPVAFEALSEAVLALKTVLDESTLKKLRELSKGTFTKSEQKAIADHGAEQGAVQRVVQALQQRLGLLLAIDAAGYERVRQLLHRLLLELRRELRREGIVTFQDLLQGALAIVRNPHLCQSFSAGIEQLFVDEFQDTDPVQCELVERLALDPKARRRPGLFIGGDPKQSIYAWRSADLQAYEDFKHKVTALGGELGLLARNYRSTPKILSAVEAVFSRAMRPEPGVQPPFQPLVAHKDREGSDLRVICTWDASGEASADRARELEARWIAHDILTQRDQGTPFDAHAILVRRSGQLEALLTALREADIPYEVRGDRSFYRRREILDAAAWLRTAIDPTDTLALVAALRSSACGVPDAAWIPLENQQFLARMTELQGCDEAALARLDAAIVHAAREAATLLEGPASPLDWPPLLRRSVRLLGELRHLLREGTIEEFFTRLREGTRLELLEARRYLGEYRLANLQSFFDRMEHRLTELDGDGQALLRDLRRDLDSEREQREAKPLREASEAVQLMTIHQSKGLDFPRVYLVGLNTDRTGNRNEAPVRSTRLSGGRTALMLDGLPDLLEGEAQELREAIEQAEHVRTFYVAMTRPKDELILMGNFPGDGYTDDPAIARSHAGMLPCLGDAMVIGSLASREAVQHGPFRILVPEAATCDARPGTRRSTAGAEFPPARVRGREPARQRESLTFSASPSAAKSLRAGTASAEGGSRGGTGGMTGGMTGGGRRFGTAVHAALEEWFRDPQADLTKLLEPRLKALGFHGTELCASLQREPWLSALANAREQLVAAELDVFATANGPDRTALHLSARVDLITIDPDSGAWVLIDFKTDAAQSIPERLPQYTAQLEAYRSILRRALPPQTPVRCELWFLMAGAIRKLPD
ncbi:MAG: UvrD-helicase domain-containing protein [Planctomycetia bacterium]